MELANVNTSEHSQTEPPGMASEHPSESHLISSEPDQAAAVSDALETHPKPVSDSPDSPAPADLLTIDAAVGERIDRLLTKVDDLSGLVAQRGEFDQFRDEAIQRMSRQLEAHERGMMRKIKETLLKDIIGFYDTLENMQRRFERTDDRDSVNRDIELLKDQVTEILYRNDVTRIDFDENPFYNRETQIVVRKETTGEETEHNRLAGCIRQGFLFEDKLLRKQEVIVKEFKATSLT